MMVSQPAPNRDASCSRKRQRPLPAATNQSLLVLVPLARCCYLFMLVAILLFLTPQCWRPIVGITATMRLFKLQADDEGDSPRDDERDSPSSAQHFSAKCGPSYSDVSSGDANTASSSTPKERPSERTNTSCEWKPNDDDSPCIEQLIERIQASFRDNDRENNLSPPLSQRRWLFLGDSLMARLFKQSPLQQVLVTNANVLTYCPEQYACSTHFGGRCDTNEQLLIPRRQQQADIDWIRPNATMGEGPTEYGLEHPYCQDCDGCGSVFLSCVHTSNSTTNDESDDKRCLVPPETSDGKSIRWNGSMYGGYISIEFARDVEVQSPLYTTTQQNVLSYYVNRDWNDDTNMMADFGKPICVVGNGFHDVGVHNMTLDIYKANVRWYLQLLNAACDFVVWISTTCPLIDTTGGPQIATMRAWNDAVLDILRHDNDDDAVPSAKTFFIDVFEASRYFAHHDNLHMVPQWYDLLGHMLLQVVQGSRDSVKATRTAL